MHAERKKSDLDWKHTSLKVEDRCDLTSPGASFRKSPETSAVTQGQGLRGGRNWGLKLCSCCLEILVIFGYKAELTLTEQWSMHQDLGASAPTWSHLPPSLSISPSWVLSSLLLHPRAPYTPTSLPISCPMMAATVRCWQEPDHSPRGQCGERWMMATAQPWADSSTMRASGRGRASPLPASRSWAHSGPEV